jgi:hypothetical protein
MGEVIRPWRFFVRNYVKWQIENKRGQIAREEALRAARRAKRLAAQAQPQPSQPEAASALSAARGAPTGSDNA